MTTTAERTEGRTLIAGGLFGRLAACVVAEHDVSPDYAARIIDQTVAFLATSAVNPGEQLVPSSDVDKGWHAFILYTRDYAAFCDRVAGRFLHHVPNDDPGALPRRRGGSVRTVDAIERAGYVVDPDLWQAAAGNCSQDDCSASGADGNENRETRTDER
jgi:hypothetical protein